MKQSIFIPLIPVIALCLTGAMSIKHPGLTASTISFSNPEQIKVGRYVPLDMQQISTDKKYEYGIRLTVRPSFLKIATYAFWFNSSDSDSFKTIEVNFMEESDKTYENYYAIKVKRQKIVQSAYENWDKKDDIEGNQEELKSLLMNASAKAAEIHPFSDKIDIDLISGQISDGKLVSKLQRLELDARKILAGYKKRRIVLDGVDYTLEGFYKSHGGYYHYKVNFWTPPQGTSEYLIVKDFFSNIKRLSSPESTRSFNPSFN